MSITARRMHIRRLNTLARHWPLALAFAGLALFVGAFLVGTVR